MPESVWQVRDRERGYGLALVRAESAEDACGALWTWHYRACVRLGFAPGVLRLYAVPTNYTTEEDNS